MWRASASGSSGSKMKAVRCYASQFHQEGETDQPRTWIGSEGFLGVLVARAMHYGSQIHKRYGEPLLSPRQVPMDDPVAHYARYFEV